jgi:glycine dehydrogenase
MAIQTREQHIRRDKANSNICTSQALLANISSFYAVYHGAEGLKRIASRINRLTSILAVGLKKSGFRLRHNSWFDTITVEVSNKSKVLESALEYRVNLRSDIHNAIGITLDETTCREDIDMLFNIFLENNHSLDIDDIDKEIASNASTIPSTIRRRDSILSHPIFNNYHSESEMMRYMYRLEKKDIALNQSMIPLGSCTMKLNSSAEMVPISWPEFAGLHPFCPLDQAEGYLELINQLSWWLENITGYDQICIQPNSGAQGEYAGLLAIRRYHESIGQSERRICLIPSSAHGTNPASARMAGMTTCTVNCNKHGNIDLDDLREKVRQADKNLSCIMITYPSTHGVYEETICKACCIVHEYGGQVYLDGANMNAQVGITTPALIGADVAHLNLHKTFCIPHGGGGPGVGPIGVKKHLAPFLPGHSFTRKAYVLGRSGAISGAPFGSPLVLPISWMYIRMMGSKGLKHASEVAMLNANYIASCLREYYPILYTGHHGYVAHECILDIRPLKEKVGITELDIAKRLIDYGFHAPTMSFPVPGTLMVEPTESESKVELDRFISAMRSIKKEIDHIIRGTWPRDDNPLVNAPHTQKDIVALVWDHPYTRDTAASLPLSEGKLYWAPVNRLNDVFGDRNLVCSHVV